MTMPLSPNTTYAPSSTPSTKAQDLNDMQQYPCDLYNGVRSVRGVVVGGAGGIAFARSTDSPLALFKDSAENVRSFIDHNGYPRGDLNLYYEDWLALGNGAIAGAASSSTGRLNWSVPANASIVATSGTNMSGVAPFLAVTSANAANAAVVRANSSGPVANYASFTSLVMDFQVALVAQSASDWKIGFTNNPGAGGSIGGENCVALYKAAADANWQLLTGNGGSTTKTNTGVAPTALDRIVIELHGSASPLGALARMFINGVLVASTALTLPGANAGMSSVAGATITNATNSVNVVVSPLRAVSNRFLNASAV